MRHTNSLRALRFPALAPAGEGKGGGIDSVLLNGVRSESRGDAWPKPLLRNRANARHAFHFRQLLGRADVAPEPVVALTAEASVAHRALE